MPSEEGMIGTPADDVLDRTADIAENKAPPLAPAEPQVEAEGLDEAKARVAPHGVAKLGDWLRRAWQFFITQSFSSLTRRIVFLNVTGLLALSIGIIYLSQFRAGLIDARIQSLMVQGQIIAAAIAASATVDNDSSLTLDLDKLQNLQPGESYDPSEDALYGTYFPINPERVGPVLNHLVSPTKTRARIYNPDGMLLLDSAMFGSGSVVRSDLPPVSAEQPGFLQRMANAVWRWLGRGDLPRYYELPPDDGRGYPEVAQALNGHNASMVRINDRGEVIVSVAVPVQRFRAVRGALMLSTQGADIDNMVKHERLAILKVFLIACAVMVVLSILLAGTIAEPVRRLADAAESVRRRIQSRVEIPDFTRRRDEIGHLSGALRSMTDALYSRIEAIERFAADVAHELKNPLTSLRSAVETLPIARTDDSKARLLGIIEHDVKRLDRLISDISDASRLDAELQRQEAAPVDVARLLSTLVGVVNEVKRDGGVNVTLRFEGGGVRAFQVPGHDSRLGQIVDNLIENACSFSPPGGTVRITCRRLRHQVEIFVDDDGPGVRPEAVDKIFERFYTDRPQHGFGQNSGLGLSISKQIVEAHGGDIRVENRTGMPAGDGTPNIVGARFIVRLPAM
jgi:two-component system, OmpR family, sensor histidine kinase ChvG